MTAAAIELDGLTVAYDGGDILQGVSGRFPAGMLSAAGDRWREFALLGAQACKGRERGSTVYTELASVMRDCADREAQVFGLVRQVV